MTAAKDHVRATGPVECTPWCEYGDGHTDVGFVADQICYGREARVTMSLHQPLRENVYDGAGAWIDEADYVTVYPVRSGDGAQQLWVSRAEGRELRLTLDEARSLVAAVQGQLFTITGEQS